MEQPDSRPAATLNALSPIEARILGCLIEKEATTPDVYPLTVNNVVMACNQKTARDPVMALETGIVHQALRRMEVRGLARSQHTARAERYSHRFDTFYGLTRQQTALMALLLLRGPQTAYELLARCERMAKFEDVEQLQHVLQRLMQKEPALVAPLPRRPGQREDRYRALLVEGGDFDEDDDLALDVVDAASGTGSSLRERLAALEARVAELEARLGATAAQADASNDGNDGHRHPDP